MKVWKTPLFPTLNHNTMLTNYDVMIKRDEVKIIDDHVVNNNLLEMNLEVFRGIVYAIFPRHRAEQLVGEYYHDDKGLNNYKKYLSFNK